MKFKIRHTSSNDYKEICDLGTKQYPKNYYEGEESFISKIKGCYEGCFVADLDGIIGYIISFPYFVGKSYPIDNYYEPVEDPNCWYIHDLCVSKDFRNMGVAKSLAYQVIKNNEKTICLTAVLGSEDFWSKIGFRSFFQKEYCGKNSHYMILIK